MALQPISFNVPQRQPDIIEQAFGLALGNLAREAISLPFEKAAERRQRRYQTGERVAGQEFQAGQSVLGREFEQTMAEDRPRLAGLTTREMGLSEFRLGVGMGDWVRIDTPTQQLIERAQQTGAPLPRVRQDPGDPAIRYVSGVELDRLRTALAPASERTLNLGRSVAESINRLLPRGVTRVGVPEPTVVPGGETVVAAPTQLEFGVPTPLAPGAGPAVTPTTVQPVTQHEAEGFVGEASARQAYLNSLMQNAQAYMSMRSSERANFWRSINEASMEQAIELAGFGVGGTPLTQEQILAHQNKGRLDFFDLSGVGSPAERARAQELVAVADSIQARGGVRKLPDIIPQERVDAFLTAARNTRGTDQDNVLNPIREELARYKLLRTPDDRAQEVTENWSQKSMLLANDSRLLAGFYSRWLVDAPAYLRHKAGGGAPLAAEAEGYLQRIYLERAKRYNRGDAAWRLGAILDPPELRRAFGDLPTTIGSGRVEPSTAPAEPVRQPSAPPLSRTQTAPPQEPVMGRAAPPLSLSAGSRGPARVAAPAGYAGPNPQMYQDFYGAFSRGELQESAQRASIERLLSDPETAVGLLREQGLDEVTLLRLTTGSARDRREALRIIRNNTLAALADAHNQWVEDSTRTSRF